jgi:Rho-binding antiterminator
MKYIPINCDYYDELEALATIGKKVGIQFLDGEAKVKVKAVIINLFTKDSVEYMTLDTGMEIRLDKLLEVDGKIPPNLC